MGTDSHRPGWIAAKAEWDSLTKDEQKARMDAAPVSGDYEIDDDLS